MSLMDRLGIDMDAIEGFVRQHLRLILISAFALLVFVAIIGVTVFFAFVKGGEQTMVPNVQGKELTTALLELQSKELYPRIQLRYSNSAADKGNILEQDPSPGSIVKAGRRVKLIVSRGVIIDKIDNYVGQNIDDVKMRLQAQFSSSSRPLLSLREPLIYDFSTESFGTIIEQSPLPGSDISGPVKLAFVVSRGPETDKITVPELTGLRVYEALEELDKAGAYWTMELRALQEDERPDSLVSQLPAAGTVISQSEPIQILVAVPENLRAGEVYGLFTHSLPEYPYPLPVTLEALMPSGERQLVATVSHHGGLFTLPYRLPEKAVLILSVQDREITRAPAENAQIFRQEELQE